MKNFLLYPLICFLLLACQGDGQPPPTATAVPPLVKIDNSAPLGIASNQGVGLADTAIDTDTYAESAPEFPTNLEWLNIDRPLSLAELRGKLVLLDFWTYGCINCIHNFPDLERLQADYPNELVIIGVHSAKFDHERDSKNLTQIIQRYELDHPVINDYQRDMWYEWGIKAWPTLVLIDPLGNIAALHVGEDVYRTLKPLVQTLVRAYKDTRLDTSPLQLTSQQASPPQTVLSFPGGVTVDEANQHLYIADTNHHRLIIANPATGQVQAIIGTGQKGFADGDYQTATFARPHGLALSQDGQTLYVADTGNHALRQIDLQTQSVSVLAGTGQQGEIIYPQGGPALETDLASPWDVTSYENQLYVAMAGSHQLWRLDLSTGLIAPFAGTSIEGVNNGPLNKATLAQPSGLSFGPDGSLYFADSESSAIRVMQNNQIQTLAGGADLFHYGDLDGIGYKAKLQHPLDVIYHNNGLYFVDTYNSKIKQVNPQSGAVSTLVGFKSGWRDGLEPLFYEPGSLAGAGNTLYIADTNNHSIRVLDLASLETTTLVLTGLAEFTPAPDQANYRGKIVSLAAQTVQPGQGEVVLNLQLPPGYKMNPYAPSAMAWQVDGHLLTLEPSTNRTLLEPQFPLSLSATFQQGQGQLSVDLDIFYCEAETERICLIEQVRLIVPVQVQAEGADNLRLDYALNLPDF